METKAAKAPTPPRTSGRRVEADTILPGEAGVAEVGRIVARRLEHAVEREIAERIGGEVFLDLGDLVARADQLLPRRRVDAVVTGPLDGRRGDAHVHLAGARLAHHLDDLATGRPAHDGVIHHHHALARELLAVRVELA